MGNLHFTLERESVTSAKLPEFASVWSLYQYFALVTWGAFEGSLYYKNHVAMTLSCHNDQRPKGTCWTSYYFFMGTSKCCSVKSHLSMKVSLSVAEKERLKQETILISIQNCPQGGQGWMCGEVWVVRCEWVGGDLTPGPWRASSGSCAISRSGPLVNNWKCSH